MVGLYDSQIDPLLPYLATVFSENSSTTVVRHVAAIFFYITDNFIYFKERFLGDIRVIERIYQKLYHQDRQVKAFTLRVFTSLSICDNNLLVDNLVVAPLLDGVRDLIADKSTDLQKFALLFLANLLCGTERQISFILKHSVFLKLAQTMLSPGLADAAASEVSYCLANLAQYATPAHVMAVLRLDLFTPLFAMVDSFIHSQKIVFRLVSAVLAFIIVGEEMVEDYRINPVLNELSNKEAEFTMFITSVAVGYSTVGMISNKLGQIEAFAQSFQRPG